MVRPRYLTGSEDEDEFEFEDDWGNDGEQRVRSRRARWLLIVAVGGSSGHRRDAYDTLNSVTCVALRPSEAASNFRSSPLELSARSGIVLVLVPSSSISSSLLPACGCSPSYSTSCFSGFAPNALAQTMLRITSGSPTPNDQRMPKRSAT
jgi:hypothetical protein